VIAVLVAVIPARALAGPRLYVGLFDDQAFRWEASRHANLDLAQGEGASVIRTIVRWSQVAPRRPRHPADPFAREYRFDDLDDLVRSAAQRRIEVLLTIWGTPSWANGGAGANVAPTNPTDLRDFAYALAARYSGSFAGFPPVRFFSIWNEPNSSLFLAPQFDSRGRPVAPRVYASLVRAAYAGIKRADPDALVAAGETAARGHDRPVAGLHDSESPGNFARLVAVAAPHLRFDSWAHHPYPRTDRERPDAEQPWPNVGLGGLAHLESALSRAFDRRGVELWVTEFAYRTNPRFPDASSYALQASYLRRAVALASADSAVGMFIWFGFRDHAGEPWQSGLLDERGRAKPALTSFTDAGIRFRPTTQPLVAQGPKLTASDEIGAGGFGAVALSGDGSIALIGGGSDNDGAGAAWVFKHSQSSWSQAGSKLTPTGERAPRAFGTALALSADGATAAIAGVGDDGGGAIWIFTRAGSSWLQTAKLIPNDATAKSGFGVRLALSDDGTTLIVGGNQDAGGAGAAWVFVRSGSTWTQEGVKLTANDEQGAANFGIRVALSGDGRTALIGGWNDNHAVGAAWVFTRSGSAWTQQGRKLTPNDERGPGMFGGGVALSADGHTALIGGEQDNNDLGAAWIFTRTGSALRQRGTKLTGSGESGNGWFGKTVALSADGKLALIGGHVDNAEVGAAWVFARTGAAWIQQGPKLTGSGEIGAGAFGFKLALSADGDTALVGGTDDNQSAGAAWAFANPATASTGLSSTLARRPSRARNRSRLHGR
jgi:FG-GAP repeat/Glycosyl hydrolase catalytic core